MSKSNVIFSFIWFSCLIITTGIELVKMNKAVGTLLDLHCDDGTATTTWQQHNDRAASPRQSIESADRTSILLCSVSLTGPVGTEICWCDTASPEGSRYWADELEQGRLNEQLCHPASIIKFIMRLGAVEAGQGGLGWGWGEWSEGEQGQERNQLILKTAVATSSS